MYWTVQEAASDSGSHIDGEEKRREERPEDGLKGCTKPMKDVKEGEGIAIDFWRRKENIQLCEEENSEFLIKIISGKDIVRKFD